MENMENNTPETQGVQAVDNRPAWASITGFVCSLVGLLFLGIILGIVAIVFGIISIKQQQKLKGLAIAAIIIGAVDILFFFIGMVFLAAMFSGGYY